ncbi:uncharacterized protein PGTG_22076 [Puccinia graminis f. sp. tritici CRL 75-36-700-3]|uniref:Uncharacterized protein n=1 Tax=Puccinia graminis f. sp. tritici (strain CRL 75-36-700-3 / race SCCL) TaxID=418459 RepID=H6QTF1_PUCGT|nr:uncharacterized protein PGTG_22076 [Puccinia graminis f. sp. tritici CRL 75-36-700-3]EHS64166.1 hypothetical protein PGTG_22076 [Puccinia graminis f. sp. tritici CRL 75-36-700-3]
MFVGSTGSPPVVPPNLLSDLDNSSPVNALKLERPKITSIAAFRIDVGLKGSIGFGTQSPFYRPGVPHYHSFVAQDCRRRVILQPPFISRFSSVKHIKTK